MDKMEAPLKIAAIFYELFNRGPDMSDFDSRLTLQKLIYITQAIGFDLNYKFSWYVRGPYCIELADDGFKVDAEKQRDDILAFPFSKKEKNLFSQLKTIKDIIKNPRNLELFASGLYIIKEELKGKIKKEELINKLKIRKSNYTSQEIEKIIDRLINFQAVC